MQIEGQISILILGFEFVFNDCMEITHFHNFQQSWY